MSTNVPLELLKMKAREKQDKSDGFEKATKGLMDSYGTDLKIQEHMKQYEGPSFSDSLQKNMDLLYKGRENARRSPMDIAFANMASFLDGAKDKKKLETLEKLRANLAPLQEMQTQVVHKRMQAERRKMAEEQLMPSIRMYTEQGASMLPEDRVRYLRSLAERFNAMTGTNLQVEGVDGADFMKAFVKDPSTGQIVKMDFGEIFPASRTMNDERTLAQLQQDALRFSERQQAADEQRVNAYSGAMSFNQNPWAQGEMSHRKEMAKQNAKGAKELNDEINAATDRMDSTDRLIKAFEDAVKLGAVGSSYYTSLKRSWLQSTGKTYALDRIQLEMNDLMKGIREVFGGGVLSDQDIALYKQGIASIEKDPKAVIEALKRTKEKLVIVKEYLLSQREKTERDPSGNPFTPRGETIETSPLTTPSKHGNVPQAKVEQKRLPIGVLYAEDPETKEILEHPYFSEEDKKKKIEILKEIGMFVK